MQTTGKYYRHSGAFELGGVIHMLAYGAIGAIVLGVVYGYATFFIRWPVFALPIAALWGLCVALCVETSAKSGKVRNGLLMLLAAIAAGLLSDYVSWMTYILAYDKHTSLLYRPQDLWQTMQVIDEQGTFRMRVYYDRINGGALWMIWALETLSVALLFPFILWLRFRKTPFCEHCSRWLEKPHTIGPLEQLADPKAFKAKLEQGDAQSLKALRKLPQDADAYTQIVLLSCPACQDSNFLTVRTFTTTKDKKGKRILRMKRLFEDMTLSPDAYRSLKPLLDTTSGA